MASVSSFGFGGTNAYLVVEEATAQPQSSRAQRPRYLLTVSAKSEAGVRAISANYASILDAKPQVEVGDICRTANAGRSHFSHRATAIGATRSELRARLTAVAEPRSRAVDVSQVHHQRSPRVALLFTGQGSQYTGMGRELFDTHPVFRQTLERCDEIAWPELSCSLISVIYPTGSTDTRLNETRFTQPALFALEYALAELWRAWGVRPSLVLGHSVGEYVAACVAGVLDVEEALALVARRACLMQGLPPGGGMAVVFADAERVETRLGAGRLPLSIAAINGPESTVVSGDTTVLETLLAELRVEGVRSRRLPVSHAFHSALVEPMLDAFEAIASDFEYRPQEVPIVSNVTGNLVDGQPLDAAYWRRQAREPVRFAEGIRRLGDQDIDAVLEVGPTPSLLALGRRVVDSPRMAWLRSLQQGEIAPSRFGRFATICRTLRSTSTGCSASARTRSARCSATSSTGSEQASTVRYHARSSRCRRRLMPFVTWCNVGTSGRS